MKKATTLLLLISVVFWSLGPIPLLTNSASAAVTEGTAATEMLTTGQEIVASSDYVPLFGFGLTQDAAETLEAVNLQIDQVAGTVESSDFTGLYVFSDTGGTDDVLDGTDTLVGTQTTVNVGAPTTISTTSTAIPSSLTGDYSFIVAVKTSSTISEADQFGFGVPGTTGAYVLSVGTVLATGLNSSNSLTANVTTELKGYGPNNGETGIPTQAYLDFMFNGPLHSSITSDLGTYFTVSPAVTGAWTYSVETWGDNSMYRVSFNAADGLALSTAYTVSIPDITAVLDVNSVAVVADVFQGLTPLTNNANAYSFTITTAATATDGGAFPPLANAGYPNEGQMNVSPSLSSITINFDRDDMDATTFTTSNIFLTKVGTGTVAGTTVLPNTGASGVATISNFTLSPSSEYRVTVARDVKDVNGQYLLGDGNGGPFAYTFYTASTSTNVTASYIGSNLYEYDSGGTITGVPTGFVFRMAFDNALDPSTVNGTNVTLKQGGTPVAGTVGYNADSNTIKFIPDAILSASTVYVFAASTDVKSVTGTSISAVSISLTTGVADNVKPKLEWADADNYGLFMSFSEPLVEAKAENKSYYIIKTRSDATAWSSITAKDLTSASIRYNSDNNEVMIDGLTLTPGNEFQIIASTSITDIAGNTIDDGSSANIKTGYVMDSSLFSSGGMFSMDDVNIDDFDMSVMGEKPINTWPMNSMASITTKYFIDIPITTAVPADGTIELVFPIGFNVTNVAQDAQSPVNNDFNGPEYGNVVTFDNTDPAGTDTNGVSNDGLGIIGTRTVVIKLSAATAANDFLHFDLAGIQNSATPKGYETDGYLTSIRTKNTSGVLLEAFNSMPFFITGGGTNTISGTITAAGATTGTSYVYLGSPMTGPMETQIDFSTNGNGTADYAFSNLPDGEYYLFTSPDMTINSVNYYGKSNPEPVQVSGGSTVDKDFTLVAEDAGSVYTLTVQLSGNFATGGTNDAIDIFAGSPNGFRVKTVNPNTDDAAVGDDSLDNVQGDYITKYNFYLPDGDWMVGVGPAMPQGPMAGPPPMPDWMPPMPIQVRVSGGGVSIVETSGTPNDGTVIINLGTQSVKTVTGTVIDGSGNGIANAEVYAYQPMGGFGGAHTETAGDGTFTLKVPVTGMYSVGAFKMGMPDAKEQAVDVQTNVSGITLKMKKPAYTISGKVTNGAGTGIAYAPVWAYQTSGWGHANTNTDASGNYILYVDNGTWNVETDAPGVGWLEYGSSVTINGASQGSINLQPDASVTYYTISGNVTINSTAQAYMPIRAVKMDANGNYQGKEYGSSTDSAGNYTISAPAGIYRVDIWTPDYGEVQRTDADDYASNPANTNLTSGNKTGVNIVVAAADLNAVTVAFTNGVAGQEGFLHVEGIDITNPNNPKPTGYHKSKRFSDLSSSGSLSLPDGNYHFFLDVPGYGSYIPEEGDYDSLTTAGYIDIGDASADSNTATFVLPNTTTGVITISGTIKDDSANNIEDAWVWLGNPNTEFHNGTQTNSSGAYTLTVPKLSSGNYKIGVDKPGYLAPAPVTISGQNDGTQNLTLTAAGSAYTVSGYIYADAVGGTSNTKDSGEEIPNGWVYAEETTSNIISHSPVDGTGAYSLILSSGTWRIFGAADGYLDSQYSEGGSASLVAVSTNLTNLNIKLSVDSNWSNQSKNKQITPSAGGIMDDTVAGGTGIKLTIPANALGSSSDAGTVSATATSAVAKTNSFEPFAGEGKSITATDNSGQPINNLNDYIDIEMVYWKDDIDTQVTAGTLTDYETLKKTQVSYFDASLNDWVKVATTRTAYYKVNANDAEWIAYPGNSTKTGFDKFIDDALVNETFTGFGDYKLVYKSSTNHLTVFAVVMPFVATVAPAAPAAPGGSTPLWLLPTYNNTPAETEPVETGEEIVDVEVPTLYEQTKDKVFSLVEMTQDALAIISDSVDVFLNAIGVERNIDLESDSLAITDKISGISSAVGELKAKINNFVAYGTTATQRLGAGERAGVVNSYEAAFGKLPKTEEEWNDVVKISNGRWPGAANAEREAWASKVFKQVYLRTPDRTNPADDAAVVITAYGLRPVDRNLDSEKAAINSFKAIFGYHPSDAEDWDTVRAISYSGAER
ncbi:carboxypeptidase regulatory-like domain-containing protein [Patescibacteria group bacterium]|nr:carboxypeptidase regulatory-like domain-containing protein [Patescibacteria group bacterium]